MRNLSDNNPITVSIPLSEAYIRSILLVLLYVKMSSGKVGLLKHKLLPMAPLLVCECVYEFLMSRLAFYIEASATM